MTIVIANNNPRVNYTVAQGATQSSFTIPFDFFETDEVKLYVDGVLKSITTHYNVSGGSGTTGTITMVSAITGGTGGTKVAVVRDIPIERITNFASGQAISRDALNEQLDTLTALAADLDDRVSRTVRQNDYEVTTALTLPVAADRADKILAFNSSGDISMGTSSSLDLNLDTVTIATINSTSDLDLKPSGGQVNILGTAGQDRIRFNNDATPSMFAYGSFIIQGDSAVSINSGGTFTVDASGDINMDADGGDVRFKDNGTTQYTFRMTGVPRLLSHQNGFLIETDSNGDIDIQADGGQVNILGTSGDQRITFNNDATPTMQYYQNSNNLSLGVDTLSATRTITLPDASGTVLLANGDGSSLTGVQPDVNDADPDSSSPHYIVGVTSTGSGEKTLEMDAGIFFTPSSNRLTLNQLAVFGAPTGNGYIMFEGATEDSFETFLYATDATADRAIYLPNKSGTLLVDLISDTTPQLGGNLDASGSNIEFADSSSATNDRLKFGIGADLQIYHSGTESYIDDSGTGSLRIRSNSTIVLEGTDGTNGILVDTDGEVQLYHNGSTKLETTTTGITVTGGILNTGGDFTIETPSDMIFDADGGDFKFQDGGTEIGRIATTNSDFIIDARVADKDIIFKGNDGLVTKTLLTLILQQQGQLPLTIQ